MGYTNETAHYGLPLPLGSDKTTPMDYNTALEAIDTQIFANASDCASFDTRLDTAEDNISTAQGDITSIDGRVTTVEGKVSTLEGTATSQGNEIKDVRNDCEDMITAYNEASATSTHAYAVDDYFIYNDVLYKATDAIAIGDTIVPDTNCTTTNVTTEVSEINTALTNEILTTSVSGLSFIKEPSSGDITIDFNDVNLGSVGYSDWSNIITNIPSDYCPSHSIYLPIVVSTVTYSLYLASDGTLSIRPQDSQTHTLNNVMAQVTYRK